MIVELNRKEIAEISAGNIGSAAVAAGAGVWAVWTAAFTVGYTIGHDLGKAIFSQKKPA